MVCYEAKENKIKSFAKFGLDNTGGLVSTTLISSNDFLDSRVHFISLPFLSMFVMCFIISSKLGMNLLRKFTFPRKDYTSFLLLGVSIFRIPFTLLGPICMPCFEICVQAIFLLAFQSLIFLDLTRCQTFYISGKPFLDVRDVDHRNPKI